MDSMAQGWGHALTKDGTPRVRITLRGLPGVTKGVLHPQKFLPCLNNPTALPEHEPRAGSQSHREEAYFNIKLLEVLSGAFTSY